MSRVGYDENFTPTNTTNDGNGNTNTTTFPAETNKTSVFTVGIPLAVEIPLGKGGAWTLRCAGEYQWLLTSFNLQSVADVPNATANEIDTQSLTQSASAVTGGLGLRFWPIDAFRLDAAASGSSSLSASAGNANFDTSGGDPTNVANVYLSGTFLLK